MIIAVSAQPVYDKSDVVRRLASAHGLETMADPAPKLCERYGFQTLYEMPFEMERSCRTGLLEDHVSFVEERDDVLFEYSAVEWLADWMRWFWSKTPAEEWVRVMEMGRQAAQRYGQIYHLTDGPLRQYDGYAWLDRENSRQVDALMRFLYAELGVSEAVRVEPAA